MVAAKTSFNASQTPSTLRKRIYTERTNLLTRLAEIDRELQKLSRPPSQEARPSPFDQQKRAREATADLRDDNGNISAAKVAALFGVSINKLAGWLGKSRQAISKTPAADSLQIALRYFEKISRLRAITQNDRAFRTWLRAPQEALDHAAPLDLLGCGEWQVVAELADDILTGALT